MHMAVGGIAFAVVYLGPFYSALAALAALFSNLFVLPRAGGKYLWRGEEEQRGHSVGIVLYPFSVLLLILIFWRHLEVAAAVWGILAFGDGMASLVGRFSVARALPWNARKSWNGSIAYFLFGGIGAAVLLGHTLLNQGEPARWPFWIAAGAAAAALGALLESLAAGGRRQPQCAAPDRPFLFGLLQGEAFWTGPAFTAWVAALPVALGGQPGFRRARLLGPFGRPLRGGGRHPARHPDLRLGRPRRLVAAARLLRAGHRRHQAGLQEKGGGQAGPGKRRPARRAPRHRQFGGRRDLRLLRRLDALPAALPGSPGRRAGHRGRRYHELRNRPALGPPHLPDHHPAAGAARHRRRRSRSKAPWPASLASAAVAFLGAALGLYSPFVALLVTAAAFLGTLLESLIGATLEQRGYFDNEAVNFLNTLCGALLAAGLVVAAA